MSFTQNFNKEHLQSEQGIHPLVFQGKLTEIVERFKETKGDIPQLLAQRNQLGQTPLDVAA
jgi:hypothetical protein